MQILRITNYANIIRDIPAYRQAGGRQAHSSKTM